MEITNGEKLFMETAQYWSLMPRSARKIMLRSLELDEPLAELPFKMLPAKARDLLIKDREEDLNENHLVG